MTLTDTSTCARFRTPKHRESLHLMSLPQSDDRSHKTPTACEKQNPHSGAFTYTLPMQTWAKCTQAEESFVIAAFRKLKRESRDTLARKTNTYKNLIEDKLTSKTLSSELRKNQKEGGEEVSRTIFNYILCAR